MRIPYKIYKTTLHWYLRAVFLKIIFRKNIKKNNIIEHYNIRVSETKSVVKLIKSNTIQIVRIFLLMFILMFLEHIIQDHSFRPMLDRMINYLGIAKWLKGHYRQNIDSALYLYSSIASIMGVVFALLHPLLANIISTNYSKLSSRVISELTLNNSSTIYSSWIVIITISNLMLLLFISHGYMPTIIMSSFLFISSSLVLQNILGVGVGILSLYSPYVVFKLIIQNKNKILKKVIIKGVNFNDHSFQKFNQSKVKQLLRLENELLKYTIREMPDNEIEIKKMYCIINQSLIIYLQSKNKIPVDSFWFPRQNRHQKYTELDSSSRQLISDTTYLKCSEETNYDWFEKYSIENKKYLVQAYLSKNQVVPIINLIRENHDLLIKLSDSVNNESANLIFDEYRECFSLVDQGQSKGKKYENYREHLMLLESHMSIVYTYLNSAFVTLINCKDRKIKNVLSILCEGKESDVNRLIIFENQRSSIIEYLEKLNNEKYIHRKSVTKDWFTKQWYISYLRVLMFKKIEELLEMFNKHCVDLNKIYEPGGHFLLLAYSSALANDFIRYFRHKINLLSKTIKFLDQYQKVKKEFKWDDFDDKKIFKELNQYQKKCENNMFKSFSLIGDYKWIRDFPNLFCSIYPKFINEIDQLYSQQQIDRLKEILPWYFKGLKNYIMSDIENSDIKEMLIDLLEISGFALLYSKITNNIEYYKIISDLWEDTWVIDEKLISYLGMTYDVHKNNLLLLDWANTIRFNRQSYYLKFNEKGNFKSDTLDKFFKRFISKGYHSFHHDAAELFIEYYLYSFIEAKNAHKISRRRIFKDIIFNYEGRDWGR